jgi:hypothetical protein
MTSSVSMCIQYSQKRTQFSCTWTFCVKNEFSGNSNNRILQFTSRNSVTLFSLATTDIDLAWLRHSTYPSALVSACQMMKWPNKFYEVLSVICAAFLWSVPIDKAKVDVLGHIWNLSGQFIIWHALTNAVEISPRCSLINMNLPWKQCELYQFFFFKFNWIFYFKQPHFTIYFLKQRDIVHINQTTSWRDFHR